MSLDEDVELKWRVDAWDALAGRAFLCRRQPDGDSDPQLDQPVVFVAPPYFQPEPLTSRAPGLAATRATFQQGLFIGGQEIGFSSLDDAIAFIQRGYNTRGPEPFSGAPAPGREGPVEGGGDGLAIELPELPRTAGFRQLDAAITSLMIQFVDTEAAPDAPAQPADWSLADPDVLQHTHTLLLFAGQLLISEMLRRFPVNGTSDDYVAWSGPARKLALQLARLGLWPDALKGIEINLEKKMSTKQLEKMRALALPDHWHEKDGRQFLEMIFLHAYQQRWDGERLAETDIYQDLASFPLPHSITRQYHVGDIGKGRGPTLLTLLSAWFGCPRNEEEVSSIDRALLLFGGACVVVGPLQRENPTYHPWWFQQNAQSRDAFRRRLGQDTWKWISKQLPDRIFQCDLEYTLRTLPQIWPRALDASGSDPVKPKPVRDLNAKEIAILSEALGDFVSDMEETNAPVPSAYS